MHCKGCLWFCFAVLIHIKLFIPHVNTSPDSVGTNKKDEKHCNGDFIIISTIDGKITAVDKNYGIKCWSFLVDSEKFLSSTLSRVEIYEKNDSVILIPSLDGGLYKYILKSKTIQQIPVTVDALISNSIHLDPSINVVGGKMKLIFGIDRLTGELIYSCNANGCNTYTMSLPESVIVIEEFIYWVKALNSIKGEEKWHFRVVELKVKLSSQSFNDNAFNFNEHALISGNFKEDYTNLDKYKVSLQNAFVGLKSLSNEEFVWLFKTKHPITDVWYLKDHMLMDFDPFEEESEFVSLDMDDGKHSALLFLGIYENQMFIKKSKQFYTSNKSVGPLSPFVLYQNYFLPVCPKTVFVNGSFDIDLTPTHTNFSVDHGVYFYANISVFNNYSSYSTFIAENSTHCISNSSFNIHSEQTIPLSYRVSVFLVALCALLLTAYLAYGIVFKKKIEKADNSTSFQQSQETTDGIEFISRFHHDFELMCILGEGGFGIVIDAKNKIDDCHYAIKRICLNEKLMNSAAYERVLREVKALAKLDHHGIVRYFNAWVEYPPAGWQDQKDKEWNMPSISYTSDSAKVDLSSKSKSSLKKPLESKLKNRLLKRNPFKVDNIIWSEDNSSNDDAVLDVPNNSMDLDPREDFMSGISSNDNSSDNNLVFADSGREKIIEPHDGKGNVLKRFWNYSSSEENVDALKKSSCESDIISFQRSIKERSLVEDKGGVEVLNPFRCSASMKNTTLGYLYIQMQLCKKGSLRDWLDDNSENRQYNQVMKMFFDIVDAVEYVHNCGLMHRDLKPSNILFALDDSIKIGDFGLATSSEMDKPVCTSQHMSAHTSDIGTEMYMSPEQKLKDYNNKTDVYSLGIIFFELLVPFKTYAERYKALVNIRSLLFPQAFKVAFKTESVLLGQLLDVDPMLRPTAKQLKEHKLLKKYA